MSGAASTTCSKLSRMSRASLVCKKCAIPSRSDRWPASRTSSACAIAERTRAGSWIEASGTNQMPSGKSRAASSVTRKAIRVLPTPPGPVRVTSGTSSRRKRARTAASSRSRPIKGVRGRGSRRKRLEADMAVLAKHLSDMGNDSNLALSDALNWACWGAPGTPVVLGYVQQPGQARSRNRETTRFLVQIPRTGFKTQRDRTEAQTRVSARRRSTQRPGVGTK